MEISTVIFLASNGFLVTNGESLFMTKLPYVIRHAQLSDVEQLRVLEIECWNGLESSQTELEERITNYPGGQWVAVVDQTVVGVIYSQKIESRSRLQHAIFAMQSSLHCKVGAVLQLLGVAVLPKYTYMQIGNGLRDFVLSLAKLDQMREVVALTRCLHSTDSKAEYVKYVYSKNDPILKFHCNAGAEIIEIVDNYREADYVNWGCGILISYNLSSLKEKSGTSNQIVFTTTNLKMIIESVLSKELFINDINTFELTPLLTLGIESLHLTEIRIEIEKFINNQYEGYNIEKKIKISPIVFFSYPTPRELVDYIVTKLINVNDNTANYENPGRDHNDEDTEHSQSDDEVFAVCGISCRFPGEQGYNPFEFFQALCSGYNAVTSIPEDWKCKTAHHAAFLTEEYAEYFDYNYFGLTQMEAQEMDPHQRILLELAHEALTDANVIPQPSSSNDSSNENKNSKDKVGVFVGICNNEWIRLQNEFSLSPYSGSSTAQSSIANRISYLLNLSGPSMVIDTACSSSLVALHTALNAIKCGDCDVALVAAADLMISGYAIKIREASNMLSPDGVNKTFDEKANGYVRGEGAGAIVIKRFKQAQRDVETSPILGVICGSAVNQDGKSASFTAPNGQAQKELLASALKQSHVNAKDVVYIEAHGTGTALGDPIEFEAIREVFLRNRADDIVNPLTIGAVKTNIGHLEGAAGIAGLIKTLLCLQNNVFVPNLHLNTLNPLIDVEASDRRVIFPSQLTQISRINNNRNKTKKLSLYAGISSFGSGGTNAHVIVKQYQSAQSNSNRSSSRNSNSEYDEKYPIAFLCAGQGLCYINMGRELYHSEDIVKETIRQCSDSLNMLTPSLVDVMFPNVNGSTDMNDVLVNNNIYSQLAIFALEVALARLWISKDIYPSAVFGHSLGEYVAMVIAGIMTLEHATLLLYTRVLCIENNSTNKPTAMIALKVSEQEGVDLINKTREIYLLSNSRPLTSVLTVACINGPKSIIISGDKYGIDRLIQVLSESELTYRMLPLRHPYHSPLLTAAAIEFEKEFGRLLESGSVKFIDNNSVLDHNNDRNKDEKIAFVSCYTGKRMEYSDLCNVEYWKNQMLYPVQFYQGIQTLYHDEDCRIRLFIEIGPGSTLSQLGPNCLTSYSNNWISTLSKNEHAAEYFKSAYSLVQSKLMKEKSILWQKSKGGRFSSNYHPVYMPWRLTNHHAYTLSLEKSKNKTSNSNLIQYLNETSTVDNKIPPQGFNLIYDKDSIKTVVMNAVKSVASSAAYEELVRNSDIPLLSLGIDSLGALAIRNIISKMIQCDTLVATLIMKYPTVSSLIDYIYTVLEDNNNNNSNSSNITHSSNDNASNVKLRKRTLSYQSQDGTYDGIVREFVTTSMQQAMLFHHISDPEAHSFIETFEWNVIGHLDIQLFRDAWSDIILLHPTLRTSFDLDAIPVVMQRIHHLDYEYLNQNHNNWFELIKIPTDNNHRLDGDEVRKFVKHQRKFQRSRYFDLSSPMLFFVSVIELPEVALNHKYIVQLTIHHVIVDGISMQVLLRSLCEAYQARKQNHIFKNNCLSSYYDYVKYEQKLLIKNKSPDASSKDYWQRILAGWVKQNQMKNLPALAINAKDDQVSRTFIQLDPAMSQQIMEATKYYQVTPAVLFHTAWAITYCKLCDNYDILYGNTSSGRSANIPHIFDIIGPVINTYPVRLKLHPDMTIVEIIKLIQNQFLENLEHENYPLSEIQKITTLRNQLFSLIFDYQSATWDSILDNGFQSTVHEEQQMTTLNLHKEVSVKLANSRLYDRIGCPLSIRVIFDNNEVFQLHATSECIEFSPLYLDKMLSILQLSLQLLTNPRLLQQYELSPLSVFILHLSSAEEQKFECTEVKLPLILTLRPRNEEFSKQLSPIEFTNITRNTKLWDASLKDVFQFAFGLSIYQHNTSNTFYVRSLYDKITTSEVKFFSINNTLTFIEMYQSFIATNQHSSSAFTNLVSNNALFVIDKQGITSDVIIANIVTIDTEKVTLSLEFPNLQVPVEVVNGIIQRYQQILTVLCSESHKDWNQTVSNLLPQPSPVSSYLSAIDYSLLHQAFLHNCHDDNKSDAVVYCMHSGNKVTIDYSTLNVYTLELAFRLCDFVYKAKQKTIKGSSTVIAVVMEKGWEQVVAVLSIHRLQCVYLPIDARLWSENRIRQVLTMSESIAVLTQSRVLNSETCSWMKNLEIPVIEVDEACENTSKHNVSREKLRRLEAIPKSAADDLAYLIYTSGSTGVPKGVCCHHVGAVNTINDLNEKFKVCNEDKVLALSSLSFDLSVYDIFGLLSAGGCVVIPHALSLSPPDAGEWFEVLLSEQVTIWNTVPAFMELVVSHCEYMDLRLPACLRLIFMSGDWIPVTLPARIRAVSDCETLQIISMGGATEAAIWSNIFELGKEDSGIPEGWTSVPYGKPMRNQRMYILNDRLEHCEVWVTGSIYIGGIGVAHGYYKNAERTAHQFIQHPVTGEKLFRTGDLGRVRPGGLLEILGREDSQVKVNGFRIELGEIEKVICKHPSVLASTLTVHNNVLCAYIVLRLKNIELSNEEIIAEVKKLCKLSLTEYMVPAHYMILSEIPLSSNGKVLREKLPVINALLKVNATSTSVTEQGSNGEVENNLLRIWSNVLSLVPSSFNIDSNFFSIGGDSLRSVQVVAQSKKNGILITVPQIFTNPTIRSLAQVASSVSSLGPDILGTANEEVSVKPIFTVDHFGESEGNEEYPLIGINQAHFVGLHTSTYASKGMTPQIYFEWEVGHHMTANKITKSHHVSSNYNASQVNVEKLEQAIDVFVKRHGTFRSIVTTHGTMQLLHNVPPYKIVNVYEWNDNSEESQKNLMMYRTQMMEVGPTVHSWPLFEVRITHTSKTSSIIHITVSLFLMDAMSDLILRQELSIIYRSLIKNPALSDEQLLPYTPSKLLFKDYCIALNKKLVLSDEYIKAREYWMKRLSTLSTSPDLPMLSSIVSKSNKQQSATALSSSGIFVNYHRWLNAIEWRIARKNCSIHSVTMPAVLLAAYSLVLYKWCTKDSFLINILQCLRHQVHEDVNKMVGNCSSTILCDINLSTSATTGPLTFKLAVQRIAQELSRNLEHASMSGVEVMQELNRVKGKTFNAVAPFIFTTPIGVEKGNKQVQSRNWMFQEKFFSERVPHTACVNAIKADPNGTACASLDIVKGAFPIEVMEGMYSTYSLILNIIASEDSTVWTQPISSWLPSATAVPPYLPDFPVENKSMLHDGFIKNSQLSPCNIGVVQFSKSHKKQSIEYQELEQASNALVVSLFSHVCAVKSSFRQAQSDLFRACVIAVVMEKGWEQVVAVLSIHRLQCVYLPIDARLWSENRIRQVLTMSESIAVLTQSRVLNSETCSWMKNLEIPVFEVDEVCECKKNATIQLNNIGDILRSLDLERRINHQLAYLIYTSGSTGIPKGVCCHHVGALNTINDLNEKFKVCNEDKVLALSSLSFDLSVYDIFGLLSAGGCVVIPDPDTVSPPDPSVWFDMVLSEQVTIWNTVPAFMELVVSHCEYMDLRLPACLRLIFMSGDWIPVTLPARIRAVSDCETLQIISMGGATEAAIWSNIFELGKEDSGIPEGWTSVPYGKPMRNQRMYILNDRLEHCEVWVTGSIYIGGIGVAHGYYKNAERTAHQFIQHPVTGEKLFRTGDLGRVRPGGLLEILGREDSQVKVNGFRIELGEIEKVICEHPDVVSASLTVHSNVLCAYLVLRRPANDSNSITIEREQAIFADIKLKCKTQLTEYMVPTHFMVLNEIPLSSNGKVQRDLLPNPVQLHQSNHHKNDNRNMIVQPRSNLEITIRTIFASVLHIDEDVICCEKSTFFELGGNSITAIQLLFGLRKIASTITIQDMFRFPTIQGICDTIVNLSSSDPSSNIHGGNNDHNNDYNQHNNNAFSSSSTMHIICLKDGIVGNVNNLPIIMSNPAGASGLCYMELAQQIKEECSVYVLDDNIMISGGELGFTSIQEVIEQSLPLVTSLICRIGRYNDTNNTLDVVFAGWSYGGIIMLELAKVLHNIVCQYNNYHDTRVNVVNVVLFDSPIIKPRQDYDRDSFPIQHVNSRIEKEGLDIRSRTHRHFDSCTSLLDKYYLVQANALSSERMYNLKISDIRPTQGDNEWFTSSFEIVHTIGTVTSYVVPGNHWTMLFNENVHNVSKIVNSILSEQS